MGRASFTWEEDDSYMGSLYEHSAAAILERVLQTDNPWMAIALEAGEIIETCNADHDLERRREMLFAIRALGQVCPPKPPETAPESSSR